MASNARVGVLIVLTAAAALGASACSSSTATCSELKATFSPADTTLPRGRSFTPSVALSACGNTLQDTYTFESSNTGVATVNRASGQVTTVAPGTTDIAVAGQQFGALGAIHVAVTP